jgi:hypothetical protein
MPLLRFVFFKRLFFFVRPFQVLGAMLSSPCFCNPCSVPRAIFALRVILLPAAANVLRGPQFTSRVSLPVAIKPKDEKIFAQYLCCYFTFCKKNRLDKVRDISNINDIVSGLYIVASSSPPSNPRPFSHVLFIADFRKLKILG